MDKNTYVYCTNCIHGENLIKELIKDTPILPNVCESCYPYNPEDSVELEKRINYKSL